MVARRLLTATAVGLSVGLLAQHATGAETEVVQKAAPVAELVVVDSQLFRDEIEAYVRELNRQLRTTLNEDLRRELNPKMIVLASNELRSRS